MSSRWSRLAAVLSCGLCGCGSLVDATARSGIRQLSSEGGVVESDLGVKLWLPPGALERPTTVMLTVLQPAPEGTERAVEVSPPQMALLKLGVLTFASPKSERPKIAHRVQPAAGFAALPGRRVDPTSVSAPVSGFGVYALINSAERCGSGADEDGDGLTDCADPACAGDSACGLACQTNDDCACGAVCIGGGCGAPNPRFCASAADCTNIPCGAPTSHGAGCGFSMCVVQGSAFDGGTSQRTVAACTPEAEECACEPCTGSNECPGGTLCLEATRKGGTASCGRNVCK